MWWDLRNSKTDSITGPQAEVGSRGLREWELYPVRYEFSDRIGSVSYLKVLSQYPFWEMETRC
jgi:hypothetical protein